MAEDDGRFTDGQARDSDEGGALDRDMETRGGSAGFDPEPEDNSVIPPDVPDGGFLPDVNWGKGDPVDPGADDRGGRGRQKEEGLAKLPRERASLHPATVLRCLAWWMHRSRRPGDGNPPWPSWDDMKTIYLEHVSREHAALDVQRYKSQNTDWQDLTQYDFGELHMDGFRQDMRAQLEEAAAEAARFASRDAKRTMGERLLAAMKKGDGPPPRELLEIIAEEMDLEAVPS